MRKYLRIPTLLFACAVAALANAPETASSEMHEELIRAVNERRVIQFVYQGRPRIVEPHAYGVVASTGDTALHAYQTQGESASGTPPGWRTFAVAKIERLRVVETRFKGPRPGYAVGRPAFSPLWVEVTEEKP